MTGSGTAPNDTAPNDTVTTDPVTAVADAVLFEGYMLYPYRANDPKNRVRWQFGVLAPPAFAEVDPSERTFLQTDLLLEGAEVTVSVQARFLQVQRRTVERRAASGFEQVDALDVGAATYLPWDEAVVQEPTARLRLPGREAAEARTRFRIHSGSSEEHLGGIDPIGRLVRRRDPLAATLTMTAVPLPGPYGVRRLRLRLDNRTTWRPGARPERAEALRSSLLAAHLVVRVDHGAFVSLIDPPEWARGYVEQCEQVGCYPVLAGPPGDRRAVLAAPIILYDHPSIAPESAAQFCDATEMDEMLTLRTLTLTDTEKRQVRGSDPRAAALVDHVDDLPPQLLERLHGAIRSMTAVARPASSDPDPPPWWDPVVDAACDPDNDVIVVDGVPVGRGCVVRLRPGSRRSDAQDMFLAGRIGTVEAVVADVDDGVHLAVTLDELAENGVNLHGRFLYFAPDEVEPLVGGRP